MLGKASKVLARKESTIIVVAKVAKLPLIKESRLSKTKRIFDPKYDKEKIDERIAKLSGGVAVIRVGAATETGNEMLKLKIEDAGAAAKAAIAEGIVAVVVALL